MDPRKPPGGARILAPTDDNIRLAAERLRAGAIVAMPTETVYGLAADAFDERAVARVFAAKGRPANHPLIAHVLDEAQARALAASWPEGASRLASAFWPGPLTLVVPRAPHVPAAVAGGGSSIAVRAPSHAVARAVIEALGHPVAAPSANRFQGLSATTAAHVAKALGSAVNLVLDAGACEGGIESTVVDVRGETARVLRVGGLSLTALRRQLPDVEVAAAFKARDEARDAPGMDGRHYAPLAQLVLAVGWREAVRVANEWAARCRIVGLVTHAQEGADAPWGLENVLVRSLPVDPVQYARLLYSTLHNLDDAGADVIVVQNVPMEEAWGAVADRLRRGATH